MREVKIHPYVEEGVLKVTVFSMDRENRAYEVLSPDGPWSKATLYLRDPVGAFAVSKERTEAIAKDLAAGSVA